MLKHFLLLSIIFFSLQANDPEVDAPRIAKSLPYGLIYSGVCLLPKIATSHLTTLKQIPGFHYPRTVQEIKKLRLLRSTPLVVLRQLTTGLFRIPFQAFFPDILRETYHINSSYIPLCTGLVQAGVESLLTQPLDYYRVRTQVHVHTDFLKHETLWKDNFVSWRRGLLWYSLNNTLHAITFMSLLSYVEEKYKKYTHKTNLTISDAGWESLFISLPQSFVLFPLDNIKLATQLHPSKNTKQILSSLYRKDKIRGFYKGFGPSLFYNLFSTWIAITSINTCKNLKTSGL